VEVDDDPISLKLVMEGATWMLVNRNYMGDVHQLSACLQRDWVAVTTNHDEAVKPFSSGDLWVVLALKIKEDSVVADAVRLAEEAFASEPGCLQCDVYRAQQGREALLLFVEVYKDDAAHKLHLKSPHYLKWGDARVRKTEVIPRATMFLARSSLGLSVASSPPNVVAGESKQGTEKPEQTGEPAIGSSSTDRKFILCTAGEYFLAGESASMRGPYTFDLATGRVVDVENGSDVGVFTYEPISPAPLAPSFFDCPGTVKMPCITVVESEIMAEIQKHENADAYFVVPSQWNAAEYPSPTSMVQRVEEYRYDNAGGARAQLAVHPAPGQFLLDNAASEGREGGINAVDQLLARMHEAGMPFELINGYLKLPQPWSEKDADAYFTLVRQHLHTVRSLVMDRVPANGLTPRKKEFSSSSHKVGLIYASSVPLGAYTNHATNEVAKAFHGKVAEVLTTVQYYGALRTVANKTPKGRRGKIFMMTLGSGAFNNPLRIVAKSMSVAVEMLTDAERVKLDMRALSSDGKTGKCKDLREFLAVHHKLV